MCKCLFFPSRTLYTKWMCCYADWKKQTKFTEPILLAYAWLCEQDYALRHENIQATVLALVFLLQSLKIQPSVLDAVQTWDICIQFITVRYQFHLFGLSDISLNISEFWWCNSSLVVTKFYTSSTVIMPHNTSLFHFLSYNIHVELQRGRSVQGAQEPTTPSTIQSTTVECTYLHGQN